MVENANVGKLQQTNFVLFEIYVWNLIIRIESWFFTFPWGMNGMTNVHILYVGLRPPYNVRVGYSIHTSRKRKKSTINS